MSDIGDKPRKEHYCLNESNVSVTVRPEHSDITCNRFSLTKGPGSAFDTCICSSMSIVVWTGSWIFFSSLELQAQLQVRFSDRFFVRPSVCKLCTFSFHWTNFDQTWHKTFLGKETSNFFK